ncbi:MAG TPA: hypothetical protein VG672_20955, partial [Bryobacteraceae bacterium]|nr:hypothetical protein [Bryobacteraceae bacterium]
LEPRLGKVASEGAVTSYLDIARARLHEDIVDIVVPGVLEDFDLPDLALAIAPRPLWIVNAQTPTGAAKPLAEAKAEFPDRPGLRVLDRPEGWAFSKVYAEWLR